MGMGDVPRASVAIWWMARTGPGIVLEGSGMCGRQWELGMHVGPWSGWAGGRTVG